MASDLAALNQQNPIGQAGVDMNRRVPVFMETTFYRWLLSLIDRIQTAPSTSVHESASGLSAAVPTADLVASPSGGLYRVSWVLRISLAATVSSSVQVTITHTASGVACATAGAALTTNTPDTPLSGSIVVRADAGAPITYAVAYASVGATAAQYDVDVLVEML